MHRLWAVVLQSHREGKEPISSRHLKVTRLSQPISGHSGPYPLSLCMAMFTLSPIIVIFYITYRRMDENRQCLYNFGGGSTYICSAAGKRLMVKFCCLWLLGVMLYITVGLVVNSRREQPPNSLSVFIVYYFKFAPNWLFQNQQCLSNLSLSLDTGHTVLHFSSELGHIFPTMYTIFCQAAKLCCLHSSHSHFSLIFHSVER